MLSRLLLTQLVSLISVERTFSAFPQYSEQGMRQRQCHCRHPELSDGDGPHIFSSLNNLILRFDGKCDLCKSLDKMYFKWFRLGKYSKQVRK